MIGGAKHIEAVLFVSFAENVDTVLLVLALDIGVSLGSLMLTCKVKNKEMTNMSSWSKDLRSQGGRDHCTMYSLRRLMSMVCSARIRSVPKV